MSESFLIGGGQFSGPSAVPLGTAVNRLLGIQGPAVAGLPPGGGDIVQAIIVGDTSDGLSRQLLTSRGVQARQTAVAAGQVFQLEFQAGAAPNAGGGSVIERVELQAATGAGVLGNVVGFNRSPGRPFLGGVALQGVQIGGLGGTGGLQTFTASTLIPASRVFVGSGAAFIDARYFAPPGFQVPIFVPPGTWLSFECAAADAGIDVTWAVVWRELPEA